MAPALIQLSDYKDPAVETFKSNQLNNKHIINNGVEEMLEYTQEFKNEIQEIIAGEHTSIPDGLSLAEYIASLPDEENDA